VQLFQVVLHIMQLKSWSLQVFCAVADAGSLQGASARVGLSPSAISRVISGLEIDLRVSLFDRRERRMELTALGREFQAQAREALHMLDALLLFGSKGGGNTAMPLRIAAFSRHAETVVAPALARSLLVQPSLGPVKLDVHAQRDFGFSRLARPFDVGFGHLVGQHDDLEQQFLALSPLVAVLPPGHALASKQAIDAGDLHSAMRIKLASDTFIERAVTAALGITTEGPATITVSHTYVALRLVREGLGIHITDWFAALGASESGCPCIPLTMATAAPTISAFWSRRSPVPLSRINTAIATVQAFLTATQRRN
jgi:DNA-binding transcriptional LysR family regulator